VCPRRCRRRLSRASAVSSSGNFTLAATAPPETNKAIVLPSASLDDYVGTYKLADKFLLKVFRMNDGLFARATGHVAFPIFPSAPNEFFAKVAGINLSFTRDPNGAVSGLVLHLNGLAPFPIPPAKNGDRAAPKLSASALPPEPREIELDAATLGDYVGKYLLNSGARCLSLNRVEDVQETWSAVPRLSDSDRTYKDFAVGPLAAFRESPRSSKCQDCRHDAPPQCRYARTSSAPSWTTGSTAAALSSCPTKLGADAELDL
jgi:hypothetical protein